jgi:beta-galactosidase
VDETNQWFDSPLPGRLSDVFGIRTAEFYRPTNPPEIGFNGKTLTATIPFYEVVEPRTAKPVVTFSNTPEKSPAMTVNAFGKGRAFYLAVPSQISVLSPLVRSLYAELNIERGPETPAGVYARVIDGRMLVVNTTNEEKSIAIAGTRHGVLSGKSYTDTIRLQPYDADLVE